MGLKVFDMHLMALGHGGVPDIIEDDDCKVGDGCSGAGCSFFWILTHWKIM